MRISAGLALFVLSSSLSANQVTVQLNIPISYLKNPTVMAQYDQIAIKKASNPVTLSHTIDENGVLSSRDELISGGRVIARKTVNSVGDKVTIDFIIDTSVSDELLREKEKNDLLHHNLMSISDNLSSSSENNDILYKKLLENTHKLRSSADTAGTIGANFSSEHNLNRTDSIDESDCNVLITPKIVEIKTEHPYQEKNLFNIGIKFKINAAIDECFMGGNIVINIGHNRFAGKLIPNKSNYNASEYSLVGGMYTGKYGDNYMVSRISPASTQPIAFRKNSITTLTSSKTTFSLRMLEDKKTGYFWGARLMSDTVSDFDKPSVIFIP
jgi:hypothetical protein